MRLHPRSQKGVALLLTLLVITIMILTVGQISYSTKVEVQIANNFRDDLQNLKAAQSGIYLAQAFLRIDAKKKGDEGNYHSLQDTWASGLEPQQVGKSTLNITIKDEEQKFNILRLIQGNETEKKVAKEQFLRLVPLLFEDSSYDAEGLANVLIQWMTNEEETRKNRKIKSPLYTLNEFRLIPDFLENFFPAQDGKDYTFSTLIDGLTMFSSGKININTAPPEQLQCLHEKIPEEFVLALLNQRTEEEGYFKTINEFKDALELEAGSEEESIFNEISPYLTVKSDYFSASLKASTGTLSRNYRAFYLQTPEKTTLVHWEHTS